MKQTDPLPGLEFVCESRAVFGDPCRICLGNLTKYPEHVLHTLRRELERYEFAGIPAFARGKQLYLPHGCCVIYPSGVLSPLAPLPDFDTLARHAAAQLATDSDYSCNRTFLDRYPQEDQHA